MALSAASGAVLSGFRLCTVMVTLGGGAVFSSLASFTGRGLLVSTRVGGRGGGKFVVDVGHLLVSRRNLFVLTFGRPVRFFRTPVRFFSLPLCQRRVLLSDRHLHGQLVGAHAEFFGALSRLFGSPGCFFHEAPPPR